MSLEECVADYIKKYRRHFEREFSIFANSASALEAVTLAASCQTAEHKRHPHQCLIRKDAMKIIPGKLTSGLDEVCASKNFEELHQIVNNRIGTVFGIGELTVYDISLRIGVFLGLSPEKVYLHAGARDGAKALGLSGKVLDREVFPRPFDPLTAAEIEDCLCIYKDVFLQKSERAPNCRKEPTVSACSSAKQAPASCRD